MNDPHSGMIILVCAVLTFATRFAPFALFAGKKVPPSVAKLGEALPRAVIAILVVYCLKDVTFLSFSGFVPQALAAAVTAAVHLWKRNNIFSIFAGTAAYMALVQLVFPA